jgi:ribosomal protein S18 acetylase RimI-like enzyme
MTVRITPFQMSDYDAAVELWRSAEGVVLGRADERDAVARFLSHNDGLSFVARSEGRLAGAVLCGTDGRRGFLHHLAVGGSVRRRGIGTALVERCLEALRRRGIEKCHLFVLVGNEDAQRFWERTGWSVRRDLVMMSRVVERTES